MSEKTKRVVRILASVLLISSIIIVMDKMKCPVQTIIFVGIVICCILIIPYKTIIDWIVYKCRQSQKWNDEDYEEYDDYEDYGCVYYGYGYGNWHRYDYTQDPPEDPSRTETYKLFDEEE